MFYWIAMTFITFMAVVFIGIPYVWHWIPWLILLITVTGTVAFLFPLGQSFTDRPRSYLTAMLAWIVGKVLWFWMLFSNLALLQTNNMSRAVIASVGVGGPPQSLAETHLLQAVFRVWHDLQWWPLKPWGITQLGRIVNPRDPGSWAILCLKYDLSMAVAAIGLMFLWNVLSIIESHFWGGIGWILRGGRPPQMAVVKPQQSFTPGLASNREEVADQQGGVPPL